jgi:hypothetical protein
VAVQLALAFLITWLAAEPANAQLPAVEQLERGTLPVSWLTAASCPETPAFRVHEYNPDLFILRQSGCTNFEKPFLYLLFGERSAMLVDTDWTAHESKRCRCAIAGTKPLITEASDGSINQPQRRAMPSSSVRPPRWCVSARV